MAGWLQVVYSVIEDACYKVGMRSEQTRKLFGM